MSKETIAIVTDSACDLPASYLAECENLYVLPLQLVYPEGSYKSGVDIKSEEVFARMKRGEVPQTSLPSPDDVKAVLGELKQKAIRQVVFVMMSSALSGTLNMVRVVAQQYEKDFDFLIYDSKILSMSLGYMVMNAVELVRAGVPFSQLDARLRALREDVDGLFYLPSLEYLVKGGRIGLVAGTVGKLLNIKPIIGCNGEGAYYARATCIGAKRTMAVAKRIVADFVGQCKYELSVMQAAAPKEAQALLDELKTIPGMVKGQILPLSPVLCVHVGEGMLAVCTRRHP